MVASYRPHEGKFAIVTGGSRGIGAAITENLAAKGANILIVYTSSSSTEPTQQIIKRLSSEHNVHLEMVQADLASPTETVPKILDAAKQHFSTNGKLQVDILINNAGVAGNKHLNDPQAGPIEKTQFDWIYAINVLAPLLLTQAVQPHLPTDRSGRIVNVSSVSSSIGYEGQSVYAGTKAAVEAMTRVWSRELGENATVNAVNPGPVHGDMYTAAGQVFWDINQKYADSAPLMLYKGNDKAIQERAGGDPEKFDDMVLNHMGGRRPGFTDEIAGVVGMLCSAESGWTTGSVICANGGMKMSIA